MSSLSTASQAEVIDILRCKELLLSKNVMIRRIHICYDSRAAIAAITALAKTTTEFLVWESMRGLEKLSGSHTGTPGIMEYREKKRLINWPGKGLMEYLLTKLLASLLLWAKKTSWSRLRQEQTNRWENCKFCRQSKTLMFEALPSKTKEPQTKSRQKLKAAVGLSAGRTTFTANMFKLGLTHKQDCQLCSDEKI
jgi:hypothetical protein